MMHIPFTLQFINLLAALLLLIAFAMLTQRRILSLINLFAMQGAVLALSTFVVAIQPTSTICITPPALPCCSRCCCCPGCCTA